MSKKKEKVTSNNSKNMAISKQHSLIILLIIVYLSALKLIFNCKGSSLVGQVYELGFRVRQLPRQSLTSILPVQDRGFPSSRAFARDFYPIYP